MPTFWERESKILDPDKRADVPFSRITVHGILIESRYGKKRELLTMSRAVEDLLPPLRNQVITLFCDSKATASYSVAVRNARYAKIVGTVLDDSLQAIDGGHNGIWVNVGSENAYIVEPDWGEGFDDPKPAA